MIIYQILTKIKKEVYNNLIQDEKINEMNKKQF